MMKSHLFPSLFLGLLFLAGSHAAEETGPAAIAPDGEKFLEKLIQELEKMEASPEKMGDLATEINMFTRQPAGGEWSAEALEHFESRIRPVLMETCFKCHGGDKVSNGLRVDSRETLLHGGERGSAIAPEKPEESLLIRAIRREGELKMPPNDPLPPNVVDDFVKWIAEGAPWPKHVEGEGGKDFAKDGARHWAFQPVNKDIAPPEDPSGWSSNPIDRFIKKKLDQADLAPVGVADKRSLIRRAYFDLIGLPPSPDEIDAFLEDDSPEAYRKLVDRLLASPRYGERWGRHWMDVVRYSDTAGDSADFPVPELYLYRQYIIDSINRDKPYDQFIKEQLAGDILAKKHPDDSYAEKVIATGFVAVSNRFGNSPYQHWEQVIEDSVDTVGRAFVGLALQCARCHDHKFDPVTNEDYYALYGIFDSTQYPWAGSETFRFTDHTRLNFVPLLPPEEALPKLKPFWEKAARLKSVIEYIEQDGPAVKRMNELDKRIQSLSQVIPATSENPETDIEPLRRLLEELNSEKSEQEKAYQKELRAKRKEYFDFAIASLPQDVPMAYAVSDGTIKDAHIHKRGKPGAKGDLVPRGVPKFLEGDGPIEIPEGTSGRFELAEWLVDPDHPLTARVMANRIWHYHFGKGIVASPNNFGLTGDLPTHPELLDWLAGYFIHTGWSFKEMHRLIMNSKTYRLSTEFNPESAEKDPANSFYWRYDRRRLDAESIRDAMLAVSGNLDESRPGRQPFPPLEDFDWSQHRPFKAVYPSNHRSVYLMTQRIQKHPYLALFDGADANRSTGERPLSNVPLQALFLMNNPFVKEQAEAFSKRVCSIDAGDNERVDQAIRLAWGRPAEPSDLEKAVNYLDRYQNEAEQSGMGNEAARRAAWTSYAKVLLSSNEFFYLD